MAVGLRLTVSIFESAFTECKALRKYRKLCVLRWGLAWWDLDGCKVCRREATDHKKRNVSNVPNTQMLFFALNFFSVTVVRR